MATIVSGTWYSLLIFVPLLQSISVFVFNLFLPATYTHTRRHTDIPYHTNTIFLMACYLTMQSEDGFSC